MPRLGKFADMSLLS